jgi:hypothetical protein
MATQRLPRSARNPLVMARAPCTSPRSSIPARARPGRGDARRKAEKEGNQSAALGSSAAHGPPCAPSASDGWGGRSRRADGTARARPDAIATRRLRLTHGPLGATSRDGWGGRPRCADGTARARPEAIATRGWRHTHGVMDCQARAPSCSDGWGRWAGRSQRSDGTARFRLAAIATRRWRPTHEPPSAQPLPVTAGEGGRDARAAQRVLVPTRPRRAAGGASRSRPALVSSSSDSWGGRSRRADSTARASRRVRDAPLLARTRATRSVCRLPVTAGEGSSDARTVWRVLVSTRSRRASDGTHMGRLARALLQRRLGRAVVTRPLERVHAEGLVQVHVATSPDAAHLARAVKYHTQAHDARELVTCAGGHGPETDPFSDRSGHKSRFCEC